MFCIKVFLRFLMLQTGAYIQVMLSADTWQAHLLMN